MLRLLKVTDMFRLAIWQFYFKLLNNILPAYFNLMKPSLPVICNMYDIRKPRFHLPKIKHTFAEHLLEYRLIILLNNENGAILITSKVHTHSFLGFKLYLKNNVIESYVDHCDIVNCESCQRLLA